MDEAIDRRRFCRTAPLGVAAAKLTAHAKKFTGKYQHRTVTGGIGHNLPQDAPQAFAQAIMDVTPG